MKELIEMSIELLKETLQMAGEKDQEAIKNAIKALEELSDETLTGEDAIVKLHKIMEEINAKTKG